MSKKHFILLADCLRESRPSTNQPDYGTALAQWQRDVGAVAKTCAASNPLFKRERWTSYIYGACGPNGGEAV